MNKLKINRTHYIAVDNIKKFVIRHNCIWVYQIVGYPKVYKCRESWYILKNRLINLGKLPSNFRIEYETK